VKNHRYKRLKCPTAILEQEGLNILSVKFGAEITVEDYATFLYYMSQ